MIKLDQYADELFKQESGIVKEHPQIMKFALLLVLLIGTQPSHASGKEVVKFAIGEYPPYTSTHNHEARVLETLVKAAFLEQSIEVEYLHYPWKRSMALARNGDVDGTFPWLKNADRQLDFYFSHEAVYQDKGVYWHLRTTPFDWNTSEDLRKYRFGVTVGYTRTQNYYKQEGIEAASEVSEEQNFKKLLAGRIDVYRTSRVVGTYLVNNLFDESSRDRIVFHPKAADDSHFFVLFSKKTDRGKALESAFSTGLAKLKASGKYKDIIQDLDHFRSQVVPERR